MLLGQFRDFLDSYLRSHFATAAQDGFSHEDWMRVVGAAKSLGFAEAELLQIVRPQSQRLIEKTLADVRSDGKLTSEEYHLIRSLLDRLQCGIAFRHYIESQLERLELLTKVVEGRLPVLQGVPLELHAGEAVHYHANAAFARPRRRQGQIEYEDCEGQLTITDVRMLFCSPELTVAVNHRRVIKIVPAATGFELRANGKGGGQYRLEGDVELGLAIYRIAVGKVNQTIINCSEDTRRIARDVRQRVWQRDGGRCVECGATQYLEFDHIIPVARGGDNSERNVQILCRGCNARKSDHI
jgi:hypothetical protein